jgi:hypothetical protein
MARSPRKPKISDASIGDSGLLEVSSSLHSRPKALVFISHDSRDGDLAEAFSNLLLDVSGGMLKSFRSSDKKGSSGIEFGEEWYTAIISQLGYATDVVALLSQRSIDRPWILYEAGMAKGKLDTTVIGVALGVPLDRVVTGPFGQFHNCADDEDSQTKLVMQLLQRNPDASPREDTVRQQVRTFRKQVETILNSRGKMSAPPTPQTDDQSTAKLFEEVKAMVRELPDRIDERGRSLSKRGSTKRMKRFHPMMFEELLFHPGLRKVKGGASTSWMIVISMLRDDFPWLYEPGMELYRALRTGHGRDIERSRRQLLDILNITSRGPLFHELMAPDDKESFFFLRHLDDFVERVVSESRRGGSEPELIEPPVVSPETPPSS